MKLLMIGGGGREHALIRKLKESPRVETIYCAPGNGGISRDAQCVAISAMDIDSVVAFSKENQIDLVFVAPDDPLAAGMVDALEAAGIRAFGPSKLAAEIESSKVFSKNLMKKYGIPTARYEVFDAPETALSYILEQNAWPAVIKADGLALGKGVVIAQNEAEARDALHSMMEDKIFGESGSRVVVEEFLTGPEVSVLAFTDGETVRPMVSSMDHKRAYDGDKGPNTGGMGTISPNPYYTAEIAKRCMEEIFLPTVRAMQQEGRPFKGCLYFGLMLTPNGPKVIEYNSRFGDPETQVVLPRLKTPLIEIVEAVVMVRLRSRRSNGRIMPAPASSWRLAAIQNLIRRAWRSQAWTTMGRSPASRFITRVPPTKMENFLRRAAVCSVSQRAVIRSQQRCKRPTTVCIASISRARIIVRILDTNSS